MNPKKLISVNSVAEEYVYISKQRCKCGGILQMIEQEFNSFPLLHDILKVTCEECLKKKKFLFDVSSFFDKQAEDILFKKMGECPYCGTVNGLDVFRCKNEDCLETLPPIDEEENKRVI